MPPRRLAVLVVAAAVAASGAACSGDGSEATDRGPKRATGRPIVVGLINQESGTVGAFPEVRRDAEAAVRYVNEELNGLDGRPIRLEVCATNGTAESSEACATDLVAKAPIAVLGGIDVGAGSAVPVLQAAGIPYVGVTPSLGDELINPAAFMLAGGVVADLLAETEYITGTLKAKKVGVVHLDLPGLTDAAVLAARAILKLRGVTDLKIVEQKGEAADFTAAVRAATASNPEVLMAIFPSEGCVKVLRAVRALRVSARLFVPSACATQAVFDLAPDGMTFATGFVPPTETADPDVATYLAKLAQFGPAGAAPSVLSQAGFALVMNVHRLLAGQDGSKLTGPAVTKALKAARDEPGFMGHPYTCNGQTLTILPAICNAHVRLLAYRAGAGFEDVGGGWMTGAPLIKLLTG